MFNSSINQFPDIKKIDLIEKNKSKIYFTPISTSPQKRQITLNDLYDRSEKKNKLVMKIKDGEKMKDIYRKTNDALNKFKNNHCLKFENYTPRKSSIRKIPYNTENNVELPNYYTEKYIKGNIDFEKISSNKKIKSYFEEIAKKIKNPPLGLYQPKYNSVMDKIRDIYFTKKTLPSSRQKKLKDIIYSYDVPYNYQIVPSLNETP